MAYDDIEKEDHSYNATRAERSRNKRSWRLVLNAEGAQGPLDQRNDYKQVKENMQQGVKEPCSNCRMRKRTNSSTKTKSDKGPTSSLKVTKRTRIDLIHLVEVLCSRDIAFIPFLFVILVAKVRQLVVVEPGNSDFFGPDEHFACRQFNLLAIDGGGVMNTPTAHTFFLMRSFIIVPVPVSCHSL